MKLVHKPKLASYEHVIKMAKRFLARQNRSSSVRVKSQNGVTTLLASTGKYIPLQEDQKHAKDSSQV